MLRPSRGWFAMIDSGAPEFQGTGKAGRIPKADKIIPPPCRPAGRRRRLVALIGAAAIGVVSLGTAPMFSSAAVAATGGSCVTTGSDVTCTYSAGTDDQTFTVPEGVKTLIVEAQGGAGGTPSGFGGGGALITNAHIGVQPGDLLYVEVGSDGGNGVAGSNGGAPGIGGGGGASTVQTQSKASCAMTGTVGTDCRLVVAGGGGGGNFIQGSSGGNAGAVGFDSAGFALGQNGGGTGTGARCIDHERC